MAAIAHSVGEKSNNDFADVILVQMLLNNWIMFGSICNAVPALVADGDCGAKTKLAIRVFQVMTGIFPPDGKISPGGPTFTRLAGPLTLSPTMSAQAALQKAKQERDAIQKKIDDIEDKKEKLKREYNLVVAKSALSYTRGKLSYGAGNKWDDFKSSSGFSSLYGLFGRIGDWNPITGDPASYIETLYNSAASAMAVGAGNCYEFGAVAFTHLNDRNIKPIELMGFKNADHVYVLIGRPKDSKAGDPSTWGPNCAICDGWAAAAYNVSEFESRMRPWGGAASIPKVMLRRQ